MSGPKVNLFDESPSAIKILASHLGVTEEAARSGLLAVVKAGWYIGPHEPTNTMLVAYMNAIAPAATNHSTIANSMAKARRRWKAMGEMATRTALSKRSSDLGDSPTTSCTQAEETEAQESN